MQPRPVNHNPLNYKFPITAIASIGHRISGVLLFIAIPFALAALPSLKGTEENFNQLASSVSGMGGVLLWLFLGALFYHLLAGIRHLIMDCGIGETIQVAKVTAWGLLLCEALLLIAIGVLIWV